MSRRGGENNFLAGGQKFFNRKLHKNAFLFQIFAGGKMLSGEGWGNLAWGAGARF